MPSPRYSETEMSKSGFRLLLPTAAAILLAIACGPREYSGPVQDRPPSGQVAERSAGSTPSAPQPADDSADDTSVFDTPATQPAEPIPTAGAIRGDILLVNEDALTADEVLYAIRNTIEEAKSKQTRSGLLSQLDRWIRSQAQQEVGTLLVYQKAASGFDDERNKVLDKAVGSEVERRIAREFGGSTLRYEKHLKRYGLTPKLAQDRLKRQLIVRSYTQDMFLPQINIRREELLAEYKQRESEYSTPETRELWMIDAPFERFLPNGGRWTTATTEDKSIAWLAAEKHIRQAADALALRPFETVAAEMSLAQQRENGGLWGMIGKPLQPPYDVASGRIFKMAEQQISEPIQTDVSWCIVRCGRISPATRTSFEAAQDNLRTSLREQRYNKLATGYVLGLADKATLVGFESFLRAAALRAASADWPAAE